MAVDLYRLRNADSLALREIGEDRLAQYAALASAIQETQAHTKPGNRGETDPEALPDLLPTFLSQLATIQDLLQAFRSDVPSDHFMLDTNAGSIVDLAQ